jgi:hypothetical protein
VKYVSAPARFQLQEAPIPVAAWIADHVLGDALETMAAS